MWGVRVCAHKCVWLRVCVCGVCVCVRTSLCVAGGVCVSTGAAGLPLVDFFSLWRRLGEGTWSKEGWGEVN